MDNEVRLVFKNGISYTITRSPGEFDIDERRSWIQSQVANTDTDTNEIIRMSMFRYNYKNGGNRYSQISDFKYQ